MAQKLFDWFVIMLAAIAGCIGAALSLAFMALMIGLPIAAVGWVIIMALRITGAIQ